jgi:hypothetical protein
MLFFLFHSLTQIINQVQKQKNKQECDHYLGKEVTENTLNYYYSYTPNNAPELIVGNVKSIKSILTYDLPVLGLFLAAFFQIEAMDPPARNR